MRNLLFIPLLLSFSAFAVEGDLSDPSHFEVAIPVGLEPKDIFPTLDDFTAIFKTFKAKVQPGVGAKTVPLDNSAAGNPKMRIDISIPLFGKHNIDLEAISETVTGKCGDDQLDEGLKVVLDMMGSSHHMIRRVKKIEVIMCTTDPNSGANPGDYKLTATTKLVEGHLRMNPDALQWQERKASEMVEKVFLDQVPRIIHSYEDIMQTKLEEQQAISE
ncbi:MAG: hypothetical protein HOE90_04900 [Bacteriovoracaceae bacterium]|jgi:hypothetical protein|nr:hypothetical protein [Bacteriovoracaceae bacterium]